MPTNAKAPLLQGLIYETFYSANIVGPQPSSRPTIAILSATPLNQVHAPLAKFQHSTSQFDRRQLDLDCSFTRPFWQWRFHRNFIKGASPAISAGPQAKPSGSLSVLMATVTANLSTSPSSLGLNPSLQAK